MTFLAWLGSLELMTFLAWLRSLELKPFLDWGGLLSDVVTLIGVPVAIILYFRENKRQRREREYGTYHALDDKYIDYLKTVLDHPGLNMMYIPLANPPVLNDEQRVQQMAIFEILLSIFERAFLMYADQRRGVRQKQWEGWRLYIVEWTKHPEFRPLWTRLGGEFDRDFVIFINRQLR